MESEVQTTLWKLNSFILNDSKTVEKLEKDVKDYLEFNDDGIISPIILWDTLKVVLRGKIISLTSYMKKCRGKKLADLQARLKQLQSTDSRKTNAQMRSEIKKVQGEIDNIYTLEIQKKLTFLKQRNYEVGSLPKY